jgi:hypothetical protein
MARQPHRFGEVEGTPNPGAPKRNDPASAEPIPRATSKREVSQTEMTVSVVEEQRQTAWRTHGVRSFGRGRREARHELTACATDHSESSRPTRRRLRPTTGTARDQRARRDGPTRGFGQGTAQRGQHVPSIPASMPSGETPNGRGDPAQHLRVVGQDYGSACERHLPLGKGPRRFGSPSSMETAPSRKPAMGVATSRCGNTLKWSPRAGEVERRRCLHPKRSTR